MKIRTQRFAITACIIATSVPALAQDGGYWRAASKNAGAVTGDIGIADDKLTISFSVFTIAQIRQLQATEINSVFNTEANTPGGNLYRLSIPAHKIFLHKNTLCGAEDTQWMATYIVGKTLQVAFFSGSSMPVLTAEALADTANLCGAFTYSR